MILSPQQKINKSYDEALALQKKGKLNASIVPLQKIIKLVPHHFAAWNSLGEAYLGQQKFKAALDCFAESLKWCPNFYPASLNMAQVYIKIENTTKAENILSSLLEIFPNLPEAFFLLYQIENLRGKPIKSIEYLSKYIHYAKNESNKFPHLQEYEITLDLNVDILLLATQQEKETLKKLENGIKKWLSHPPLNNLPQQIPNSIFCLAYYQANPKPYLEQISKVFRHIYPCLNYSSRFLSSRKNTPCIGVVTSYLDKFHSISFCYARLIKELSQHFPLTYFRAPTESKKLKCLQTKEVLGNVKVIDLPADIKNCYQIIDSQQVDILWYLDVNMTSLTYLLAHARLAPTQCVSAGHPCTTGISTIDYFISSSFLEGDNWQNRYTEKMVGLPVFPVIYEDYDHLNLNCKRSNYNLPENRNLYFCAQTLFKIHPEMDRLFAEILRRDSKGLILFSYANTELAYILQKRLSKSLGDLANRCIFINPVSQEDFFSLLGCVDVLLDSFPFGGGNTVCQSISIGVPSVTLATPELRGAGATGMYKIIGVEDSIALSPQEYIDKAIHIVSDKEYRSLISEKILKNKHKIFNKNTEIVKAYCNLFSAFFEKKDK